MKRTRIMDAGGGLRVAVALRPSGERSVPGDSSAFWADRVATMLGRAPTSVEIVVHPGSPPRALGDGREFGISFARTNGARACAVNPVGMVGVDIERSTIFEELDAMMDIALTDSEVRNCSPGGPFDRARAFLTHWTAKEAVLKAVGVGLRRDPRSVEVEARPGWSRAWHAGSQFRVWTHRTRDFVIAAATPLGPVA